MGGQQPRWREVWPAPPAVRDQREWLRYRLALVRIQTGLKNRIHAVLHRHGIVHEFSDLFGRDGRRFVSAAADCWSGGVRNDLVRERASSPQASRRGDPLTLWSGLRSSVTSDLFVSGPPAPDEIM